MDAASRSVNIELNYDDFTLDSSTILQNQFYQHSVYYVASSFLFNLKDEEGFDRDLIFDRKSLLADISDYDVDAVVRLCPYFAVEGKRIGLELLVRKTVLRKGFQTGGRITVFLDKVEVTRKGRDGILELNPSLFNFKQESNFFEQEVVKPDRVFVCAILDKIAEETGQVEKVSDTVYKMSQELTERLLALNESFSNLFLRVGSNCEGLRCLQQVGKIEQKCHPCGKVLSSEKYTYASAGDKQCISRYKLYFDCSRKHSLKRKLTEIESE